MVRAGDKGRIKWTPEMATTMMVVEKSKEESGSEVGWFVRGCGERVQVSD